MNKEIGYKCDLCDGEKYIRKPRLTGSLGILNKKFEVVSCAKCNLHSINPIPNDIEFKEIYKNYSFHGNRIQVEKQRIKKIYPRKIELIKEYFNNAKSILDIGAGNGGFVSIAFSEGFEATGIELECKQVELAKEIFGVHLINMTFEEYIKKYNAKFDVVHLHHVFEHVQRPSKILADIKNSLTPNGIVIMEVPNQFFKFPHQLYFFLRLKKYNRPYNPYHHLYFYSKKTLLKYFERNGYNVLYFNDKTVAKHNVKDDIKNKIASILRLSTSSVIEVVASPIKKT